MGFKLAEIMWKMKSDGVWVTVTRGVTGWSVTVGDVCVPSVERVKSLIMVLRDVLEFTSGLEVEGEGKVYKSVSFLPPRVVWEGMAYCFNVKVTVQGNFRNIEVEDMDDACDAVRGTPEQVGKVAELLEAALKFIEEHKEISVEE